MANYAGEERCRFSFNNEAHPQSGGMSAKNWNGGWENVFLTVTCENQKRADERIPQLLALPFKHKGIICAPFLGPVSIKNIWRTVR